MAGSTGMRGDGMVREHCALVITSAQFTEMAVLSVFGLRECRGVAFVPATPGGIGSGVRDRGETTTEGMSRFPAATRMAALDGLGVCVVKTGLYQSIWLWWYGDKCKLFDVRISSTVSSSLSEEMTKR